MLQCERWKCVVRCIPVSGVSCGLVSQETPNIWALTIYVTLLQEKSSASSGSSVCALKYAATVSEPSNSVLCVPWSAGEGMEEVKNVKETRSETFDSSDHLPV